MQIQFEVLRLTKHFHEIFCAFTVQRFEITRRGGMLDLQRCCSGWLRLPTNVFGREMMCLRWNDETIRFLWPGIAHARGEAFKDAELTFASFSDESSEHFAAN